MGYDPLGDIVSLTDSDGNIMTSAYDADRRLTTVTAPPAPSSLVSAFSYDPDGRLLETRQSANAVVTVVTVTVGGYACYGDSAIIPRLRRLR